MTVKQNQPAGYPVRVLAVSASLGDAITLHWPEYLFEGIELGLFMLAACSFGTVLFYSGSSVVAVVPSSGVRLVFMGLAMGATAIAIILSPMGRRSGAHFNPIVSFTFFCLGQNASPGCSVLRLGAVYRWSSRRIGVEASAWRAVSPLLRCVTLSQLPATTESLPHFWLSSSWDC